MSRSVEICPQINCWKNLFGPNCVTGHAAKMIIKFSLRYEGLKNNLKAFRLNILTRGEICNGRSSA
jgi:hypothetical protein